MSSIEIIPLIGLVVMFVIATVFPINIGFLGFIGAFLVGAIAFGYDDKEILEVFPASIVLTIIGVTYFFGMAKQNGTIDLMVNACIRAVRGRVYLIPWVFFLVAAFLTSLGTFSPAAVALIAPAAMSFAGRTRMSPLVMGIMTINGAHAGAFSPSRSRVCSSAASSRTPASRSTRGSCSSPASGSTRSSRCSPSSSTPSPPASAPSSTRPPAPSARSGRTPSRPSGSRSPAPACSRWC